MNHNNIEIKARCSDASFIRNYLQEHNANFKGTDLQTDTYFKVNNGRLKLRQGNIENSLIYYNREDKAGPKLSEVTLYPVAGNSELLKKALLQANGIKAEVKKKREIYFIENVKFHIDEVEGLGSFVEIEAIDADGSKGLGFIKQQCDFYLRALQIKESDLLTMSYSDMLMKD
ncbi:MAG: class IV adenylate cyclase [Chitinophagaceae bacterium]|nr:class IV adenylate cyclase [Chitinophagaceae bacterium]